MKMWHGSSCASVIWHWCSQHCQKKKKKPTSDTYCSKQKNLVMPIIKKMPNISRYISNGNICRSTTKRFRQQLHIYDFEICEIAIGIHHDVLEGDFDLRFPHPIRKATQKQVPALFQESSTINL